MGMPSPRSDREGERLRLAPVDTALADRVASPLELLRELRVHREALGDAEELLVQLGDALSRHRSDDGCARVVDRSSLERCDRATRMSS